MTLQKTSPSSFIEQNISPQKVALLYSLGVKLYEAQIFDKALSLFRLTSLFAPTNPRHWIALGGCYQHLKKHHLALPSFVMAFSQNTHNPKPLLYMAHSLIAMQQTGAAELLVNAALEIAHHFQDSKEDTDFLEHIHNLHEVLKKHHQRD